MGGWLAQLRVDIRNQRGWVHHCFMFADHPVVSLERPPGEPVAGLQLGRFDGEAE